jgi:photosystem I subunit 3
MSNEADSPPALALAQQVDRTKARFDKYSRSELLCGTDGLPHLIADGRWVMQQKFYQGLVLYILLGIGWVGRSIFVL